MGKFKKVDDDKEWGSLNRFEIDLNGQSFEVYLSPVLYGFRVIGGYTGSGVLEFNWCCGANKLIIIATQRVLMNLIERGTPLNEIPKWSMVKPWFNDPEFIKEVDHLYGDTILDTVAKILINEKMGV